MQKHGKRYSGRKAQICGQKAAGIPVEVKHSTHVKRENYVTYRLWRTSSTKEFGLYLQGATEDY